MNDLLPRTVFGESEEFIGTLSQGDIVAEQLHILIRYSLVRNETIRASILGNDATFKNITRLTNLSGPPLRLKSHYEVDARREVSSNEVHWERITRPHAGFQDAEAAVGVVSTLIPQDLTITQRHEPSEVAERFVTFLLTGPRRPWNVLWISEVSFTGKRDIQIRDQTLPLERELPFKIQILPRFFYDKSPEDENVSLSTNVLSLQFKTSLPSSALSDSDFVEQAKSAAEDILLLISFAARRWSTWYAFLFETRDLYQTHIRRARQCSSVEPQWNDTLIEPGQSRQFLRTASSKLHELKAKGYNLFMPLVYYISGAEAKHVEEQFTIFFLTLERLKDQFVRSENTLHQILTESRFEVLAKAIQQQVKEVVESPEHRKLIYEKVRELNRPALSSVLESLLLKYGISWMDFYPPDSPFTLVKTRDKLFHSSVDTNSDDLILELYRLRSIVERLLLSMLGWENLSRSPDEHIKKWITEPRAVGNAV